MGTFDKIIVNGVTKDVKDSGAVRFDGAQTLTDAQKQQARDNIGAGGTSDAYTKAQTDAMLAEKQNVLTFDDAPTANSNNPVKSGGVKTLADSMDVGIDDAHVAQRLMIIAHMQHGESIAALEKATVQETGNVTLTNTQGFPFNNSKVSVPLTNQRDNLNYIVVIVSATGAGNVGEIEVSERLVNGFKIEFTGSAKSVAVVYAVIGGYDG